MLGSNQFQAPKAEPFSTSKFIKGGGRIKLLVKNGLFIQQPFSKNNKPYPPRQVEIEQLKMMSGENELIDVEKLQAGAYYIFLPNPNDVKTFVLMCRRADETLSKEIIPMLSIEVTERKYAEKLKNGN